MDQTQQQNVPFTQYHHDVYNNLRDIMMQYHAQGVPGMQKVIDGLNKQHTDLMQSYTPVQDNPAPSKPAPSPDEMKSLSDLMATIRSANTSQVPMNASAYVE